VTDRKMSRIAIEGLAQGCSKLVMGSMIFSPDNLELACGILDAFVELGGNTIDTAHIYGGGQSERAVGQWLKLRGNRADIVVITKGAHPDHTGARVTPEAIARDLSESLERLQTDYVDLYMLHRDDLSVPVRVIIDTLNEHKAAGRIRTLGVSNWTCERIEEANEYAKANGLMGFVANSPNLSLAKPNEPRWAGCVSADNKYCAWHEKSQMPLLSWSSQAGGFFTGRFSPDKQEDAEMVRVYYNDDNWERLRRARELAKERGTSALQIALAYVLHQPFPTCALIGPYNKDELFSSVQGLEVTLTPEEVRWVDLQE